MINVAHCRGVYPRHTPPAESSVDGDPYPGECENVNQFTKRLRND